MFHRSICGKLPVLPIKTLIVDRHKDACINDVLKEHYNREYSDVKRLFKDTDVTVRDFVLVKQQKKNELITRFDTDPYVVV